DDEHQPFSIDAQQASLTSYVASQMTWTLVATFTDDASGATTNRPGLHNALRAAEAGRYDVLLVYRVDRFSRRLSDLLDLLTELDQATVAFASATEPFDTSTSIGRMLVQLLGVFAEFERATIVDRVINGMTTKASKGKWPGGTRPYGYQVHPDTPTTRPPPAGGTHAARNLPPLHPRPPRHPRHRRPTQPPRRPQPHRQTLVRLHRGPHPRQPRLHRRHRLPGGIRQRRPPTTDRPRH